MRSFQTNTKEDTMIAIAVWSKHYPLFVGSLWELLATAWNIVSNFFISAFI